MHTTHAYYQYLLKTHTDTVEYFYHKHILSTNSINIYCAIYTNKFDAKDIDSILVMRVFGGLWISAPRQSLLRRPPCQWKRAGKCKEDRKVQESMKRANVYIHVVARSVYIIDIYIYVYIYIYVNKHVYIYIHICV